MFGLQGKLLARLATVPRARDLDVTQDIWLLVLAGLLIVFGGFFAGAEAALSRVSRVTADELERQGRRGAARLQQVVADPARYLNVLTLLRVACELVATVLVTVVCLDRFATTWQAVLRRRPS